MTHTDDDDKPNWSDEHNPAFVPRKTGGPKTVYPKPFDPRRPPSNELFWRPEGGRLNVVKDRDAIPTGVSYNPYEKEKG